MENIENILDKLMLNRTNLLLKRFDKELKEIIESDLEAFKSTQRKKIGNQNVNKKRLVA